MQRDKRDGNEAMAMRQIRNSGGLLQLIRSKRRQKDDEKSTLMRAKMRVERNQHRKLCSNSYEEKNEFK